MALMLTAISGRTCSFQELPPSWVPKTWPLRVQKYTWSVWRSLIAMPKVVLVGLMVAAGFTLVSAKLALILFFLLFTGPTSTHALAKAALLGGLKPWTKPEDDSSSKT